MHDWKHVAYLALYVSIGLIVAGMLTGVVGGLLPSFLGGSSAPAAA